MHFLLPSAFALSASLSLVSASQILATNFCFQDLYVTVYSPEGNEGPLVFPSHDAMALEITGEGNSFGVTKSEDYWDEDTPKLILGTSTSENILYWTLSNADGNPFEGQSFNVTSSGTSPDVCGETTTYDGNAGAVHACQDDHQILALNLCSIN